MIKEMNIAIIGLGQVGIYLYNELNTKKKILKKLVKKLKLLLFLLKIKQKRKYSISKKIFQPWNFKKKVDILFECIGLSDGISKKVIETALRNKIHVITPNKALLAKHEIIL